MSSLSQKVLKKLGKKRQKSIPNHSLERWPSNQQININGVDNRNSKADLPHQPFRGRSKTFTDGVTKPKVKSQQSYPIISPPDSVEPCVSSALEDIQKTFSSPRYFLRRKALVEAADVPSSQLLKNLSTGSEENDSLTVSIDVEGYKLTDSVQPVPSHTLYDMIEFLFMKNDVELKNDLKEYSIVASCSNEPVAIDFDDPSTEYTSCNIEIRATQEPVTKSNKEASSSDIKEKVFSTVKECLEYFDSNGLIELPVANHNDDDTHQLPRVTPIDPIPESWEALPISPQAIRALTDKEIEQQRAIWELVYTEHSHLQTLETIINVFMRCLELIRRVNLLSEDSYHNIFGYMEDIYHVHEQLWTYTFEPCLNKTIESNTPLDLSVILSRFPQSFGNHFEVYEQHCALDSLNIKTLNKALQNQDFNTYLKWCEARPECNRLELKQMLVTPMQRITRYSLLLNAIAKKTFVVEHKQILEKIREEISMFVHVVNNTIRVQEETERVRGAMSRITAYNVVDVPNELKEIVQSHVNLDLLAPMPGVELDKPRLLMVEGSLHYRDSIKQKMSAVYVFLFTDMLLITKPNRKASDKYTIIRPPFKITSLNLHSLDSESICCLVMNDYNALSNWFILKAHSASVASEWLKQISAAQQFYQDAIAKKIQTEKMMESLRSERILHGIENLESLNASLSQSLWSIHSLTNHARLGGMSSSNESLLLKRTSSSSLFQDHHYLNKNSLADTSSNLIQMRRARSNFKSISGSMDFTNMHRQNGLVLERTTSMGKLNERPRSLCEGIGMLTESKLLNSAHRPQDSISEESRPDNECASHGDRLGDDIYSPAITHLRQSPFSDDSGTEGSDTPIDDSFAPSSLETETSGRSGPFVRYRNTRRKGFVKKKLSDPQEYCSGSVGDLSTFRNLSLPEGSHPLRAAFSRTPSPGTTYVSAVSLPPTQESRMENDMPGNRCSEIRFRQKCHSLGSLDAPDLTTLTPMFNNTLYSLSEHPSSLQDDHTKPPVNLPPSNLLKSYSRSESSLFNDKPEGSHFDICYNIKDQNYKKPNVATVKEEDEVDSLRLHTPKPLDDITAVKLRLSDSTSDEVETPKSFNKSKVMFSDLTEVHSFNSDGSGSEVESNLGSPDNFQLIPGWKPPKTCPATPVSTTPDSKQKGENQTSNIDQSSPVILMEDKALRIENEEDNVGDKLHESATSIILTNGCHDSSIQASSTNSCNSNNSDCITCMKQTTEKSTTDTNTKVPSTPSSTAQSPKKSSRLPQRSKRENKQVHPPTKNSGKSVKELSMIFEFPTRTSSASSPSTAGHKNTGLQRTSCKSTDSPSQDSSQLTMVTTPSIEVTAIESKSATKDKSSSRTHAPLKRMNYSKPESSVSVTRRASQSHKRKESMSKLPVPNSPRNRKSRVASTSGLSESGQARSLALQGKSSSCEDSALMSRVTSTSHKSNSTNNSKSTEPVPSPKVLQRTTRNNVSPTTKPKPITKRDIPARTKPRAAKQNGGITRLKGSGDVLRANS